MGVLNKNKNTSMFRVFKPTMLTQGALSLIFDELEYADQIVAVFSRLVPPYPIGSVYGILFRYRLICLVDLGCRQYWI